MRLASRVSVWGWWGRCHISPCPQLLALPGWWFQESTMRPVVPNNRMWICVGAGLMCRCRVLSAPLVLQRFLPLCGVGSDSAGCALTLGRLRRRLMFVRRLGSKNIQKILKWRRKQVWKGNCILVCCCWYPGVQTAFLVPVLQRAGPWQVVQERSFIHCQSAVLFVSRLPCAAEEDCNCPLFLTVLYNFVFLEKKFRIFLIALMPALKNFKQCYLGSSITLVLKVSAMWVSFHCFWFLKNTHLDAIWNLLVHSTL